MQEKRQNDIATFTVFSTTPEKNGVLVGPKSTDTGILLNSAGIPDYR